MTISRTGDIISLNMRKSEFDMIHLFLKNVELATIFTQVMEGYLDTYERD